MPRMRYRRLPEPRRDTLRTYEVRLDSHEADLLGTVSRADVANGDRWLAVTAGPDPVRFTRPRRFEAVVDLLTAEAGMDVVTAWEAVGRTIGGARKEER